MINGMHALFYSRKAAAARAFLRDVLGLPFVDSGGGWLIFAAPPVELGVHPSHSEKDEPPAGYELYFMCTDIEETVADLLAKGIEITKPIKNQGYGVFTAMRLPGGAEIGIYEPRHPTALELRAPRAKAARRRLPTRAARTAKKSAKPKRAAAKKKRH